MQSIEGQTKQAKLDLLIVTLKLPTLFPDAFLPAWHFLCHLIVPDSLGAEIANRLFWSQWAFRFVWCFRILKGFSCDKHRWNNFWGSNFCEGISCCKGEVFLLSQLSFQSSFWLIHLQAVWRHEARKGKNGRRPSESYLLNSCDRWTWWRQGDKIAM